MPSPGSINVTRSDTFTPFEPDWKQAYYDAMLDIAQSQGGKCPEFLKDALARHASITAMRYIITSSMADGDHG